MTDGVRLRWRSRRLSTAVVAATVLLFSRPADAQLISPGKLAAAHAQLEGMSNCTKCHDLGKPGASDAKCLACHETIKARMEKNTGLHATFTGRACASCHKEHFGTEFAMVRVDTGNFDHTQTGFALKLSHRTTKCRECHKAVQVSDAVVRAYATEHKTLGRTYLGLANGCLDCHKADNGHAEQFGTTACTECHNESTWKKAPRFNHDSAKYVLTGKHRTTACEKCHKPVAVAGIAKPVRQFVGVTASSCASCHADKHKGVMRQTCESCHSTERWSRLLDRGKFEASFDHSRTGFLLVNAHAKAACAKCHNPAARPTATVRLTFLAAQVDAMFPAPVARDCLSCHIDVHEDVFVGRPGGAACQHCHGQTSWRPATYDFSRHNRETWVLTGAHIAVPCSGCHAPVRAGAPPQFVLKSRECFACHREKDPHAGQFPQRVCADCHVTNSFRIAAFDHSRTRYPLDGAHRNVACAQCHTRVALPSGAAFTRYRPLQKTCQSCHGAAIPRRP